MQEEYVARYGGRDESPIDPRDFEDPIGMFFVGYLDDDPGRDRRLAAVVGRGRSAPRSPPR